MTIFDRVDAYKAVIDEQRPFEGQLLKQLRDYYRIGLTWSSNALEGNTLTISETKVLLEDGLTIGGHPLREVYETTGHSDAYSYMFGLQKEHRITVQDMQTMHRMFYRSIDEAQAGVWRDAPVIVTGTDYAFPAPHELDKLMQELETWIESERDNMHPVEFAAMLHLKFVSIHPFIDGNGRVSRLLMNLALIQDGYMLALIPPIVRSEYLSKIRAYQQRGEADSFCEFIAERVYESEKEIMRLLHIPAPKM